MTEYVEVSLNLVPYEPWADILCHEMGLLGFETFEGEDPNLKAYIQAPEFDEDSLKSLLSQYPEVNVNLNVRTIAPENWNKDWESNFQPVRIHQDVFVHAPFHQPNIEVKYNIVILPKMSFGTGHHATTAMVMQAMMDLDLAGASVLDVGCGSGILSILAEMLGAAKVHAIDNDEWAVLNAAENTGLNNCHAIVVENQVIDDVSLKPVNVILANINKNVILADLKAYTERLEPAGNLLLSGFISGDINDILELAGSIGMKEQNRVITGEWAFLHLIRSTA